MKNTIFFYFLLLISSWIWAQPNVVKFEYDAAGNQIVRKFIYIASGSGKHSNQDSNTSKKDLIESDIYSDILYYPNPVKEELFVKWINTNSKFVSTIELYSTSGQLMKRYINLINTETSTINFSNYPAGLYNLILIYNGGDQKNLKIVKQ